MSNENFFQFVSHKMFLFLFYNLLWTDHIFSSFAWFGKDFTVRPYEGIYFHIFLTVSIVRRLFLTKFFTYTDDIRLHMYTDVCKQFSSRIIKADDSVSFVYVLIIFLNFFLWRNSLLIKYYFRVISFLHNFFLSSRCSYTFQK